MGDGGGDCNLLFEMVTEATREAAPGLPGEGAVGCRRAWKALLTSAGREEEGTRSEKRGLGYVWPGDPRVGRRRVGRGIVQGG